MVQSPLPALADRSAEIERALEAARRVCDLRGLRLTALRAAVLRIIARSNRPLGAYALLVLLQDEVGRRHTPPTIYRALDFLLEIGSILRVESRNAYVLRDHPECPGPPVLFLCNTCDSSVAIESPSLAALIESNAASLKFHIARPVIECSGTCDRCAGTTADPAPRALPVGDSRGRPGGALVPVSLLTGFLGSGKTTVLNRLLSRPEFAHTVVVINEFGEIGLDHELVESSTEDMVLLKSGCLCCTIRGDLVDTLRGLTARKMNGTIAPFDRVLIETTGLADPAPILHTLMSDLALVSAYRLDGVITTVDAATGDATLDRQIESVKQAAVADRLLLTKTDLVSPAQSMALFHRLRRLNPAAPILVSRQGEVDPASLLDAGLYNPQTKSPDVQRWLKAEAYAPNGHDHEHEHGHGHGHGHGHDINRHDEHIRAVCLTIEAPLPASAFDTWLGLLLGMRGPDVLRVKGIVNIEGFDGPLVLHGVQHVFHPPLQMKKWPSSDRRSRLVFITRDLDESALRDTLRMFAPV